MPAYLIGTEIIKDLEKYKNYQAAAGPLLHRFGGRVILSSKKEQVEVLEGKFDSQQLLVIEFPSVDAIRAFYYSKEYSDAKKLREGAAIVNLWAVPSNV
jgi:uncharacterized protein (DUF1330 family)